MQVISAPHSRRDGGSYEAVMKRECSKVGTDPARIQRGCEADIGWEVIHTSALSLKGREL